MGSRQMGLKNMLENRNLHVRKKIEMCTPGSRLIASCLWDKKHLRFNRKIGKAFSTILWLHWTHWHNHIICLPAFLPMWFCLNLHTPKMCQSRMLSTKCPLECSSTRRNITGHPGLPKKTRNISKHPRGISSNAFSPLFRCCPDYFPRDSLLYYSCQWILLFLYYSCMSRAWLGAWFWSPENSQASFSPPILSEINPNEIELYQTIWSM